MLRKYGWDDNGHHRWMTFATAGDGDDQGGGGGADPAPAADPPAPAGDPPADPAAAAADAGDDGDDGDPEPPREDWRTRRLNTEYGKNKRLADENARLKAELAKAKPAAGAAPAADGDGTVTMTQAEIDAEIDRRAEERARTRGAETEFNNRSNEVWDQGAKAYRDFKNVVTAYTEMGGLIAMERDVGFMSAAFATENPAKVLYELGKNLDEADRIAKLSPQRMAVEMDKIARARPPKQSNAPTPPTPVRGSGEPIPEGVTDQLSTAEWMARRSKQVEGSGRHRLMGGR